MIVLNTKKEKEFIAHIKSDLIKDHKNSEIKDYDDIIKKYGSPSDIASSYLQSLDELYIVSKLRIRRLIKAAIIIFILSTLTVAAIRINNLNKLYEEARENFFNITEKTEISEISVVNE